MGKQPAQHLAGAFIYEVNLGEIPAGVADLDAREVSVAVRDLEAVSLDDDGAVALALGATIILSERELQRRTVRPRSHHVGAGEEGRNRCLTNLGVDPAIVSYSAHASVASLRNDNVRSGTSSSMARSRPSTKPHSVSILAFI